MEVIVKVRPDDEEIATSRNPGSKNKASHKHTGCTCEAIAGDSISIDRGDDRFSFKFGTVLGPASTQRDTFLHCGQPLLEAYL